MSEMVDGSNPGHAYDPTGSREYNHQVLQVQIDSLRQAMERVERQLERNLEALIVRVAALEEKMQQNRIDVAKLTTKAAMIAGGIPTAVIILWEFIKRSVVP